MCSCSRAEDVTITNVIIKSPDRKWDWGVNDVMPGSDGLAILMIFEKAVSWDLSLGEASWDLKLGEASPVCGQRDAHAFVGSVSWDSDCGPRVQVGSWQKSDVGTVSIVKIVCVSLSPRVEKLKVKKVNKRFIHELKKVVSVLQDSYASEYFGRMQQ